MEAQEIDCMNKKSTNATIHVRGSEITVIRREDEDYISLTDMVRNFEGGSALIEQWLKNKDTVLFLGVWEQLNNPDFNSPEFEGIKNEAGRNSFYLSAKKWMDATRARGLIAKAGRYYWGQSPLNHILLGSVPAKSHVPSLPRRITKCFLAGCGEEGGMLDIVDC